MGISYLRGKQIFKLDTPKTSYIMGVEDGWLLHYYYGRKLDRADVAYLSRTREPPFTPAKNERDKTSFLRSL